jgi:hypothetical protein
MSLLPVLLAAGCSGQTRGTTALSASSQARGSFSPMVADASFGWLPPGLSVSAGQRMGLADWTTTQSVFLSAAAPATGQALVLTVQEAGSCRLTGPQLAVPPVQAGPMSTGLHKRRYQHGLSCSEGAGGGGSAILLTGSAPALRGMPAYTTAYGGLAWEYARDSWAWLDPQPQAIAAGDPAAGRSHPAAGQVPRPLLRRVAAHVSYRGTRLAFPFELTGVPPGWQVAQGYFTESGGRPIGTGLALGPASSPLALDIGLSLPGDQSSCTFVAGHSRYVRLDGARAFLITTDGLPFKYVQFLCAARVRGLELDLSLERIVPGTRGKSAPGAQTFGSMLTIFGHLRLLGPDPANWTTHPLQLGRPGRRK